MLGLMAYRDKMINTLTETLNVLISETREKEIYPSQGFLICLANFMDLTIKIDTMKNFKGSMNNDLSLYKRLL
jgi:cytoplasmic FMR1 interacting protein